MDKGGWGVEFMGTIFPSAQHSIIWVRGINNLVIALLYIAVTEFQILMFQMHLDKGCLKGEICQIWRRPYKRELFCADRIFLIKCCAELCPKIVLKHKKSDKILSHCNKNKKKVPILSVLRSKVKILRSL